MLGDRAAVFCRAEHQQSGSLRKRIGEFLQHMLPRRRPVCAVCAHVFHSRAIRC
jgi:hypothetical protein